MKEVWRRVVGPAHGPGEFVVMPNHVHGIVWITREPTVVGAEQLGVSLKGFERPPTVTPSPSVPVAQPLRPGFAPASRLRRGLREGLDRGSLFVIVRTFKSATAKRINSRRQTRGSPIWQGEYYEHIIRSEGDLRRVRQYILDNPRKWAEDPDNPAVFTNHVGTAKKREG